MRRGLALIVVIGILGVLAVLAVAFVAMAQLERRASEQRVNAARAYLLARSGIEDALARLDLGQDSSYGGEDWDADGSLSAYEVQQEVTHRGILDTDACPARDAMRPSFFARVKSGNPATTRVEGRERGYSGLLSGDHAPLGNGYALKASWGQGFYINGGDPAAPPDAGYNAVLRRMLGTLAEAIDRDVQPDGSVPPGNGKPVGKADGEDLIGARPSSGWRSFDQVKQLALGGSQAKLEAFKPYLTLNAWVDRKVVAPNAAPSMEGKYYQGWGEIRLDHAETRPGSRAPDFERIPVNGNGRIMGRAPVDFAWARTRRPALIALLGGLKGLYLDEYKASPVVGVAGIVDNYTNSSSRSDAVGVLRAAQLALDWSPVDDCHRLAEGILAGGAGLQTWQRWHAFCDGLDVTDAAAWKPGEKNPGRVSDLKQAKRDLLKANCNPNSDLNKFNPNASLWRSVDKQDLLGYSTELNLGPPRGGVRAASVGRVLASGGSLLASRILQAQVSGPSVLSLTTQKEFVCGEPGKPGIAGDEGGFRLPGPALFVSRSAGSSRTWGHALGLPGLGDQGAALQSYPEPCVGSIVGVSMDPADYDGSLQLATVETRTDECYGVPTAVTDMKMLARFAAGFDLDAADSGVMPCRPDLALVTPAELGNSLLHALRPNTLHPDGCYAERDRAPEYFDAGNADGFHGVLSFWIKPNYRKLSGLSGKTGLRGRPYVKWTNFTTGVPGQAPQGVSFDESSVEVPRLDQFFFLGDADDPGFGLVCHFEVGHEAADTDMEHQFRPVAGSLASHRWHLLTMFWDFRAAQANDTGELVLDGGGPGRIGAASTYQYANNNPVMAADITRPDLFGPHRIGLGRGYPLNERYEVGNRTAGGADATFDEFAIYDFGGASYDLQANPVSTPASQAILQSPLVLALNRTREGRYYKESAYSSLGASGNTAAEWFSAPLDLGGRARIRGLSWTQIVPPELPGGRISFELADASGASYLVDAQGVAIENRFMNDAFSPVGRVVDKPFRLHAVFQPNLAEPMNTPILDPLTLDDVTVLYEPLGGPRLLQWEDGE